VPATTETDLLAQWDAAGFLGSCSRLDDCTASAESEKLTCPVHVGWRTMDGNEQRDGVAEKSPKGAPTDSHQTVIIKSAMKRRSAIRRAQRMRGGTSPTAGTRRRAKNLAMFRCRKGTHSREQRSRERERERDRPDTNRHKRFVAPLGLRGPCEIKRKSADQRALRGVFAAAFPISGPSPALILGCG
jgi:hypothetical protein